MVKPGTEASRVTGKETLKSFWRDEKRQRTTDVNQTTEVFSSGKIEARGTGVFSKCQGKILIT